MSAFNERNDLNVQNDDRPTALTHSPIDACTPERIRFELWPLSLFLTQGPNQLNKLNKLEKPDKPDNRSWNLPVSKTLSAGRKQED